MPKIPPIVEVSWKTTIPIKTAVNGSIAPKIEVSVGADSSCLMHQNGIIARDKLPIKTLHIVEILAAGL